VSARLSHRNSRWLNGGSTDAASVSIGPPVRRPIYLFITCSATAEWLTVAYSEIKKKCQSATSNRQVGFPFRGRIRTLSKTKAFLSSNSDTRNQLNTFTRLVRIDRHRLQAIRQLKAASLSRIVYLKI